MKKFLVAATAVAACASQPAKPGTPEPGTVVAESDPQLRAVIARRYRRQYSPRPDATADIPPYVRAASGLVFAGTKLVIVQDDVNAVAIGDPTSEETQAVLLEPSSDGRRQFGKKLGNKDEKLDLEAAVAVPSRSGGTLVLAFGSGSKPARDKIVTIEVGEKVDARITNASGLYEQLRRETRFSGSELNVEGAIALPGVIRLFQRGNGAPDGDLQPVNATADFERAPFLSWLADPNAPPPPIISVTRYELSDLGGVKFGFTDATATAAGPVLFLASAEDSPSALDDGDVFGSRIGWTDGKTARWAPLLDEEGKERPIKAEGITVDPLVKNRVWVTLDADDPDVPSDVCVVELTGPWPGL